MYCCNWSLEILNACGSGRIFQKCQDESQMFDFLICKFFRTGPGWGFVSYFFSFVKNAMPLKKNLFFDDAKLFEARIAGRYTLDYYGHVF